MPFEPELKTNIISYALRDLPNEEWHNKNFFPFITDTVLRNRLIIEFNNARIIYKIFEGLQAEDSLLLAQVKTQVIMYVSIQEAVLNYVLFNNYKTSSTVYNLLNQERLISVSIPTHQKSSLESLLVHNGEKLYTYYKRVKAIDQTKIRYDAKVNACFELGLISTQLRDDLILLYEYRNTVHIEAEIKKGFSYDLDMSFLAYKRVIGLSIELNNIIVQQNNPPT